VRPFDYHEPATLRDALDLLRRHDGDVMPMAGGTALALLLGQGLVQPGNVVGLRRIPELHGIRSLPDGGLELGALVTHAEVEHSDLAAAYCPALVHAFAEVATVRIRNQATVGGSLAHADPAQDPPPMLMALGAEVVIEGPGGRRRIGVHELFVDYMETTLAPDELLTAVALPALAARSSAVYRKFLPRTHDDYATVAVAALVERDAAGGCARAGLALGGVGTVPFRASRAEELLRGTPLDPASIAAAAAAVAADVDPIADGRGSAAYKREMARVWTARALRDCLGQPATNGAGAGTPGGIEAGGAGR
jgi:carbon-monoxide dehydrogenase medium subunit